MLPHTMKAPSKRFAVRSGFRKAGETESGMPETLGGMRPSHFVLSELVSQE